MNLKGILSYIFENFKPYRLQRNVKFKGNTLVEFANHINRYFNGEALDSLSIDASVGEGQWTATPWIRIYDKSCAPSPQSGIYIVYLFSDDMKWVYLSLNQGVTHFKRFNKNSISSTTSYLRSLIASKNTYPNITYKLIHLNVQFKTSNARKYERANIFSIKYSKTEIFNSSDQDLRTDLSHLIKLYRSLISLNP